MRGGNRDINSNFKKHGYREKDKLSVDAFREECNQLIVGLKRGIYMTLANNWTILLVAKNILEDGESTGKQNPPSLD